MEEPEQLDAAIRTLLRLLTIDERRLSCMLEPLPFNPVDLETLSYLQHNPASTAKEVAAFLGIRATTMQSVVDRLQKRGLLHRDPSALKGRAIALMLTEAGTVFRQKIHHQNLVNCEQMLLCLNESERSRFIENMSQIASKFS